MNIDIRLSTGFWQHPKVFRLEKRLGLKGIRSLQILWCWCAQNRPDGNLAGLDPDEIEFVADWRGKKGAFVEASIGNWLDETENGYRLHEWEDYNPYQAKAASREEARKEQARNAANARWGKGRQSDANSCSGDATSNAQAYAQDDTSICSDDAQAYANPCSGDAQAYAQNMPSLTSTSTKELNINTASQGAAESSHVPEKPAGRKKAKPPDGPHYQAKSGRYLTGKRLESFNGFWQAFDFAKGKAEAADAWLDIPELTDGLVAKICDAARQEASLRPQLEAKGKSPKWAQGWLSGRRWEDYEPKAEGNAEVRTLADATPAESCFDESAWQKAQEARRKLEAERRQGRHVA